MGADLYTIKEDKKTSYFRDSYNDSNLIWLYELSYWHNLDGFINKKSIITVAKAKKLLKYLDDNRKDFIENLKKYPDYDREKFDKTYFKAKLTDFRFFLLDAIENNENIDCSV